LRAPSTRLPNVLPPPNYQGLPNTLYHNERNGAFSDVSVPSGIAARIGKGMGVAFGDYDGRWRMDVFVANDTEPNFLFHNDGDSRFTECGLRLGVALNENGVSVSSRETDFRDVDNDGRPDVFVTALSNEGFALFRNLARRGSRMRPPERHRGREPALGRLEHGPVRPEPRRLEWDIFVAGSHVMDNEELYSSRRPGNRTGST